MSRPVLQLGQSGLPGTPELHLSVDGMSPLGPNLSHWPGNRTPVAWKADLSTGICLNFAKARRGEQQEFLAGVTTVLNDHYDTDGFLSLLSILQPAIALRHEELCLLAAATGDFQTFQSDRAFAIDRIVAGIAGGSSPVASRFGGMSGPQLSFARYQFLLEHAESILARPEDYLSIYGSELEATRAELTAARSGLLSRHWRHGVNLAVLTSNHTLRRMTLNSLAGCHRVLHVIGGNDGTCYRYHDRTESWFELVTIATPPRIDLRRVADLLNASEPLPTRAQWCADPPTEPVPELYFGPPSPQAYGTVSRQLHPSRLTPEFVEAVLVEQLTCSPDRELSIQ